MILDEIMDYARGCLDGEIVSCKKHKWACQRLVRDAGRIGDPDFPYVWDEAGARNIVSWFAMLRHSKGVLSGQPISLTTWQKFRLCQIYGWKHRDTGKRRFRHSFTEVGRKNAKSQEEAGVALYEISVTAAKNGEVAECYTAGTKREQSKIVFNEAALMLKGSPLRGKFKVTRDAITHIKTGSFIKALSKEDGRSGDGTNPALLILDEYHQHQTTEFYDLGIGSNTKEPMLMIITTAGTDLTYPCYTQEYRYCSKVLDPDDETENDEYMIDICELDPDDYKVIQDVADETKWIKANPIRMSYQEGRKKIREDYEIASKIPEKMTAFLTKAMNVWVQARENGYMDMAKWRACQGEIDLEALRGWPVYVGFDMSAKIDLTSVAFVFPYISGEYDAAGKDVVKYYLLSHSFIPSVEKLMEHVEKDKAPYDAWERMGYITVTETPIVDQNAVMMYVVGMAEKYGWDIQCLCFDPANASKLMMDLSYEGYDVEEVYQSHKSLNEATQGFREQVYAGNIRYHENPVLTYAMSNAVVRRNNGLIKIDKDAVRQRIDPVDAALAAYKLAMYHEFGDSILDAIDKFLDS